MAHISESHRNESWNVLLCTSVYFKYSYVHTCEGYAHAYKECVMSHRNESSHIVSHRNESCHTFMMDEIYSDLCTCTHIRNMQIFTGKTGPWKTWASHVTWKWIASHQCMYVHTHQGCVWICIRKKQSHGTHEWVIWHGNESRYINVCMCTRTKDVYSNCTRKECAMAQMSESCHMNVCMCTHTKDVYVFAHAWSLCSHLQRTSHVASEWVIEPCDIWMGCRGQDGRWRHMNASNHVGMGHVTYKRVMSCRNESCPIWISDATDEWVVSEAWSWYL